MGLGLLLLTAGAFLRFVLGRYAGMLGAYDVPGAVLIALGVACMVLATARHYGATPQPMRRTLPQPVRRTHPQPEPAPGSTRPRKGDRDRS